MKIGYATIQGASHRKLEYNNQDAVLVQESDDAIIGIVADGCGSGAYSEVGSQLGVKKLAKIIAEKLEAGEDWRTNLKAEMQAYAKALVEMHDWNAPAFVKDYLLFTLVGFVKVKDDLTLFSYGDGVLVVDGAMTIIDQNNRPKYLNNELKGAEGGDFSFQELKYTGQKILVGSDGVEDILDGINSREIQEYESFTEFMNDEANYTNPIHLPKFLQKYARAGVLKDDCSLIMLTA